MFPIGFGIGILCGGVFLVKPKIKPMLIAKRWQERSNALSDFLLAIVMSILLGMLMGKGAEKIEVSLPSNTFEGLFDGWR